MIKLAVVSLLVVSCAPDPGASSRAPSSASEVSIEHRHRQPVLSGEPIWAAEGALHETGRCFGAAVAVGDLDGDGYRDVVVGETSCFGAPLTQGRLAIFRGGPSLPSTTPVFTELDFKNPPLGSNQMQISVADVDGDHHDDVLVSSPAGVQVFTRITDLSKPLGEPTFRVPGTGRFGFAALADFNGDRKADIISSKGSALTVWLSTPGAVGGAFTAARVFQDVGFTGTDDTNGDGKADLLLFSETGSQLFLGCRAHERDCDGGLRSTPAWTTPLIALGTVPDLNHDGLSEAILAPPLELIGLASGRLFMYLSDRKTGGLSATPAWSTISDPNYESFGETIVAPGDLDGDHRSTEFVFASDGRIYAFFPELETLATLQPGFAWPREDFVQDQIDSGAPVFSELGRVVAAAGDVNRDHIDDLVVGDPPDVDGRAGHAYLFAGGRIPVDGEPPPFLIGPEVCSLPVSDKPDLTVDAGALARSLIVDRAEFPADSCVFSEGCVGGPGVRRLLRFNTTFVNLGSAPAIVPGPDAAPELYHLNTCEGELELDGFASYELIDASGGTVATGRKQSVEFLDSQAMCLNAAPSQDYFPDSGISPGWGDIYSSQQFCQWLDATDVPDGRYTLRISVDINHILDQADVHPDTVSVEVELVGDHVTVVR